MEELRNIEMCLISQIQAQCGDLKKVNAKELGEVVDMVKDLEEAIYYCSITEAMEKSAEEKDHNMNINYYMENDMDKMYYDNQPQNNRRMYVPYMEYAPYMMRNDDWRSKHLYNDNRSSASRRMYMESKWNHNDDQQSMKELEHYIKDLGDDLTDMIKESSIEEKQVLSNKLQQLATKINNNK